MSIKSNRVVSRYYSACELNNVIDNDISTTPPSTNTNSLVRYVTCELDWNDFDGNNENINSLNQKVQDNSNINSVDNVDNNDNNNINNSRWSVSNSSQEIISSTIDNRREGGIFVTTVVEVCNSVEVNDNLNNQEFDDQIIQNLHKNPRSTNDKRRVALSDNNNNSNNIQRRNLQQRKNSQKVKKQNSVKKDKRKSQNFIIQNPSRLQNTNIKKSPSVKRIIQLRRSAQVSKRGRHQLEYAPTSNSISNNDPTDMEADLPPLKGQGFPWLPGSVGPPKLIHASLIPLPHKNTSSSNIGHTKNSSIQIDKTSRLFFNTRNPFSNLISSNPTKVSHDNKEQELPTQEVKQENRASQIFRKRLLEQSLAMSFGELVTTNNSLQSQQRPLIRKKTRKGSNARLEDREARRERRRKEREEKKAETESSNKDGKSLNDNDKMKSKEVNTRVNKSVVMSKIIDSDELEKIVVDEIKKRETLIYPQPPLRRKTNESIPPPDWNMTQKSSVLPQPPLRRKTNENIIPLNSSISNEQPPFPTHLSAPRKTSLAEGNKLHVGSSSYYSVNSLTTTPSEELDNILKPTIDNNEEIKNDDDDYEIVPENRPTSPTSSRYRLGMGLFGLFNKREQSNQSTHSSSTSNFPLSPKSPRPPSNLSKSPKSPTHFSFLPRSPKSPTKSTSSFSSFLPRYSRPTSPNPSTSPPPSSRASQLSNPNSSQISKSSRVTSSSSSLSNTKISRSSTPNNVLSPNSSKPRPAPLKSRPLTPNLQFSPHSPHSPVSKTFSLPASPISPKSLSRPLSPLKSPINPSKILRPGYTRHQTTPVVNPSTPSSNTITENERMRKMEKIQKLEAIIAETEANNKNVPKNTRPSKIRAFKPAKKTTTETSPPSAIPIPATTNSAKRNFTTASSSNTTLTNTINGNDGDEIKMGSQSEKSIRNSDYSDTMHFNPKENTGQNLVSEDGVIRVTLTPAVCR
jgi:hypothetical protein